MESENKPKARGRWVKGQSGNPGGRPRKPEVVSAFLEAIVKDANGNTINRREEIMAALYTVATTRGSKEQIKAAELLLAYDLGKPTERHEISGPDGGPLASVDMTEHMTTGEMRRRLTELEAIRKKRLGAGE